MTPLNVGDKVFINENCIVDEWRGKRATLIAIDDDGRLCTIILERKLEPFLPGYLPCLQLGMEKLTVIEKAKR